MEEKAKSLLLQLDGKYAGCLGKLVVVVPLRRNGAVL